MPTPDCYSGNTPCYNDSSATADASSARNNFGLDMPAPDGIYAHMGWVGYLNLILPPLTAQNGIILRVTSADINLKQEVTTPDVIDGRIDRTVYQLGPKIIEGSISLPVIADVDPSTFTGGCVSAEDLRSGSAGTLIDTLWCWTTARSAHGRLQWDNADIGIRYANHAAFTIKKAIVNTLSMSVAHSDVITFDIDVIGQARNPAPDPFTEPIIADFLSPARVLTWNDVTISGVGGCGSGTDSDALFESAQIREFSFEINNNAERFYSLSGRLYPIDINVGKREITGSLKLLGLQERLRQRAEAQQDNFTRKDEIRMMFFIGDEAVQGTGNNAVEQSRDWFDHTDTPVSRSGAIPFFWKKFTGVIFKIEEMSMTNSVYETTVGWLALGNDQEGYQAVVPGSSCDFPQWS